MFSEYWNEWTLAELRDFAADNMTEYEVKYFNLRGKEISRPSQNCWIIETGRWIPRSEYAVSSRQWYAARRINGRVYPIMHKQEPRS